jgi:hypothetical protein
VDGRSVIHPSLHGGAIGCAIVPYELPDQGYAAAGYVAKGHNLKFASIQLTMAVYAANFGI